ncbi:MAG: MFS transporter [Actinobacteria bacterium]|nr:MFS transporter [Actinomycetota bacterium]
MPRAMPDASCYGLGLVVVSVEDSAASSERVSGIADVLAVVHGPVRRLFLATLLNALGNGLTLSLFIVYLTQVRDIPVAKATVLLSWMAVVGMAASPLVGTLTDRLGPRRLLMGCTLAMAAAVSSYSLIHSLRDAFIFCTLGALAGSGLWGPNSTMLAQMVAPEMRQRAFGLSFMLLNLGIGLGGLISATIVSIENPRSFELLYRLDALSFIAVFIVQLTLRGHGLPSPKLAEAAGAAVVPERGWGHVVRDRILWRYMTVALLLMVCGYGSVDVGLSYFVTVEIGLPVGNIGIILFANTISIVLAQVFVLNRIQGRSRTRLLAGVGLLWALSWSVNGSAFLAKSTLALILLCLGQVLFAIGETVWAPVAPAIVNDLAPDDVRGRYNAVQSLLWTFAGTLSPLVAGIFLQRGAGLPWVSCIVLGCLVAAVAALDLRRRISAVVDGTAPSPAQ